jgi:antitoxin FitA
MPSLQIRDMPEALYQRVALAAKTEHRSMAQQAIVELERALSIQTNQQRVALFSRLKQAKRRMVAPHVAPEDLIRADRDR